MSFTNPNIMIGFHGCEEEIGMKALNGELEILKSKNNYDWLGEGVYFWENDYERALEFAKEMHKEKPFVIGAVFYLGNCLDLTQRKFVPIVKESYDSLIGESVKKGIKNKPGRRGETNDLPLRYLDCAVIKAIHDFNKTNGIQEYDSVRAAFWEGNELYDTAGFREKNHIQICIRNTKCILGYFLPRNEHKYLDASEATMVCSE